MHRNKSFLTVTLIIMSILLCSCSNDNKNSSNKTESYAVNVGLSDNSQHLDYQLQDKLIINADLEYEKNKSEYNTYKAKLKLFNKELCQSVLMPEKLVTNEYHKDAGEALSRNVTTDYYLMENEDGASLGIGGTMLYYEKPDYDYVYYAFNLDGNSDLYNADKYSMEKDLDFKDRATAFKEVQEILTDLGIDTDDNYTCYALECSTMTKEYNYIEMSDEDEDANMKSHSFNKSEECYCFVLSETAQGNPVTKYPYGNSDSGTYVSGTEITAYYGESGLIMLGVYSPYEVVETENNEKIITLDEAIEKLNSKYNSMIITDTIEVKKITLSYAAVMVDADNNEYTLVPTWVFEVMQTFDDYQQSYGIMFDAVTGEEFV